MSETMSNPTDWEQFYQQNLPSPQVSNRGRVLSSSDSVFGDQSSDATTAISTAITSSGAPSPLGSSGPASSSAGLLSPEGRVGKPVRRRSRASRRTPTTLLNTDTTNFRAMVQQFTGGPTPFAAGGHPGGPNFGFTFGGRQALNHPANLILPPAAGFHLQQYQQQQQHQHHQFQQQNQGYMFSLSSSNNNNNQGELFLQRIGNTRANMEAGGVGGGGTTEGFVVEGVPSQAPPSRNNTFLQ